MPPTITTLPAALPPSAWLHVVWFGLIGVLLIGYAILDGFDLGVGALHLFSRGDEERRTLLNSIGPVWDGNEVWLVTAGGALFAAFPHAYATAFSGFYLAFMLLLFMLIFRAVAIEFRSKEPGRAWRRTWDVLFSVGSLVAAVLFGVAVGNVIIGMPIDQAMEFRGTFFGLLRPYTLLTGLFSLAMFMNHGAIYLFMKTEGALQQKVRGWIRFTFPAFVIIYVVMTAITVFKLPHMLTNLRLYPIGFVFVVLNVLAIANIPRCIHHGKEFQAFVSSACSIAALVFLWGVGIFPNMIVSTMNPAYTLTIWNAASSPLTLKIMLIIACIGVPFVLAYTVAIYWIFRGKVRIDRFSY